MRVFLVKVDAMSHETASIIWPPITQSTGRSVDSILPPEIREVKLDNHEYRFLPALLHLHVHEPCGKERG